MDGHNGPRAAQFVADNVANIVHRLLPPWQPSSADPGTPAEQLTLALQQALVLACLELQRQFAALGRRGGSTATLMLQAGRLLTVASLGSGHCVADLGCGGELLTLSVEHRIASNLGERLRLLGAGCHVEDIDAASQGPAKQPGRGDGVLRLWPGGAPAVRMWRVTFVQTLLAWGLLLKLCWAEQRESRR
jgi:hypothetical protein